tara:strand:+ start:102 stop:500 length:399 start_codon:yes stop_codon:yes gene_type:complete
MAKISFDLVSPEKLIFTDDVGMIIVPGKGGDIGVLPNHSKLLSSLRPGKIMVYGESKNLIKSFFVSGGFVEINSAKCIVLAENAADINDLDKQSLQQEIQSLQSENDEKSKNDLIIALSKVEALESNYYIKL